MRHAAIYAQIVSDIANCKVTITVMTPSNKYTITACSMTTATHQIDCVPLSALAEVRIEGLARPGLKPETATHRSRTYCYTRRPITYTFAEASHRTPLRPVLMATYPLADCHCVTNCLEFQRRITVGPVRDGT